MMEEGMCEVMCMRVKMCVCVLLEEGLGGGGGEGAKVVLGNFAKSTGKHMCQSLFFNKGRFPVNFAKFPRTPVLQNNSDGDFICHHFLYCFRFPISPKNKKYSDLHFLINYRSSHPKCSIKKIFLKKFEKFPGKELELYLKETPTQV